MVKRFLYILSVFLLFANTAIAETLYVQITPQEIIRTSDKKIQPGDTFNFIVIEDVTYSGKTYLKKDDIINGLLIEKSENGTFGKKAQLYFEQFTSGNLKLNGVIYQSGNSRVRDLTYEFFGFALLSQWLRGAEVKMVPYKNIYTLELET